MTSARSDVTKAVFKSSTSLSSLVYFSLTGSIRGLGGLWEWEKQIKTHSIFIYVPSGPKW